MPKHILEIVVALALTLGAVVSLAASAKAGDVIVRDAYARASPTSKAMTGALYFTVVGNGQADRLLSVSTPAAGGSMLHESKVVDGIAKMGDLDAIDIPADGAVVLSPGGMHVMLMDLKHPLKRGEKFPATLTFEKAGKVEVTVPVGTVAQDGPPAE